MNFISSYTQLLNQLRELLINDPFTGVFTIAGLLMVVILLAECLIHFIYK